MVRLTLLINTTNDTMNPQTLINDSLSRLNANINIIIPFLDEGKIGPAIAAVTKLSQLGEEISSRVDSALESSERAIGRAQVKNLELSLDLDAASKSVVLKSEELATANKQLSEQAHKIEVLEKQIDSLSRTNEALEDKFNIQGKELLALRQKNPGLLEKNLKAATEKVSKLETKLSGEVTKRKSAEQERGDAVNSLKDLKAKSITYVPVSAWVNGKNKENRYRIIETNQLTRAKPSQGNSDYTRFIDTDFQLLVETDSGVSYKVHVSEWLCPIKPPVLGREHLADYPVEMDKLLKGEFEKRISKSYPELVKTINKAKGIPVEDVQGMTEHELSILKTANIKSLYDCVICPPDLFIHFIRAHNKAIEISDEIGNELYSKLHYAGCELKVDYLLN